MLTVEHTQALDKYMAIKTQYTDAMIRWKESRYFTKFSDLQKVFETNLALNKEELVYQPFEREERKLTPQEIDETEMENVLLEKAGNLSTYQQRKLGIVWLKYKTQKYTEHIVSRIEEARVDAHRQGLTFESYINNGDGYSADEIRYKRTLRARCWEGIGMLVAINSGDYDPQKI